MSTSHNRVQTTIYLSVCLCLAFGSMACQEASQANQDLDSPTPPSVQNIVKADEKKQTMGERQVQLNKVFNKVRYYPTALKHPVSKQPVFFAPNTKHQFSAYLSDRGVELNLPNKPMVSKLAVTKWGREGALTPTPRATRQETIDAKLNIHRGDNLTEWYVNSKDGLEQGFTISSKPAGEKDIVIAMQLDGRLRPQLSKDKKRVSLWSKNKLVATYDKLVSWDKNGKTLASKINLINRGDHHEIQLQVNDKQAQYPITIDPLLRTPVTKVGQSQVLNRAGFGFATRNYGDLVIIGAPEENIGNGAAYVFERNRTGANKWGLVKKIVPSTVGTTSRCGVSVAIDHDLLSIGCPDEAYGSSSSKKGSAWLYGRHQGGENNFGLIKKFIDPAIPSGVNFGFSVSIDKDTVVVGSIGARAANNDDTGAILLFERNQGGADNWGQSKKIIPASLRGNSNFGHAVAIEDDVIVASAVQANTSLGAVFIFERHEGGQNGWGQVALKPGVSGILSGFGFAVDIENDLIAVSAPGADDATNDSGTIFIFERNKGGLNAWGLQLKLTAGINAASSALFGWAMSMEGNKMMVGAPNENGLKGGAYIFERNEGGQDSWGLIERYEPTDGVSGDEFGWAVNFTDNTIVVGARSDDDTGTDSGSGYIDYLTGNAWPTDAKSTAIDTSANDEQGRSIAISEDIMAVGVPLKDNAGADSGVVYLYQMNKGGPNTWTQLAKIVSSDTSANQQFGTSVSIHDDYLIVGAPGDSLGRGAAYIFKQNKNGADAWGEVKKITASNGAATDLFGVSVHIDGETVIVGAPNHNSQAGQAYLFGRLTGGLDNWGEVKRIKGTDTGNNDTFGASVSISRNVVVVGAPGDRDNGSGSGSAYVFERDRTGLNQFGQRKKLTPGDGAADNFFGTAVDVYDGFITVGAPGATSTKGAAYVFEQNSNGLNNWGEAKKLVASNGATGDALGSSVTIRHNEILTGAPNELVSGKTNAGAVHTFRRDEGGLSNWGESLRLIALDGQANDGFGTALSVHKNVLAVGAPRHNGGAVQSGAGYVLRYGLNAPPSATPQNVTTPEDTPVVIVLDGMDPNNDPMTFRVVTQPTKGTLSGNSPNFTYAPLQNATGPDSFTFVANDGNGESPEATVSITITGQNDAPVFDASVPADGSTINLQEGSTYSLTLSAVDPDGDTLTYSVSPQPPASSFDNGTKQFQWTPRWFDAGVYTVEFKVRDNSQANDTRTVTFNVAFTDTDMDGVPDTVERDNGMNTNSADSDNDTISDLDEAGSNFNSLSDSDGDNKADAIEEDSDNDGILDRDEAGDADINTAPRNSDSDNKPDFQDDDSDNDTIKDGVDNCLLIQNLTQLDTDRDGFGDECDPDADSDGLPNDMDNCPFVANANQADFDMDMQGDVCDPDSDNDNVLNATDNCILVPNPDQKNADGDLDGDACDDDDDDDGLLDGMDNCPTVSNVDQNNTDGDSEGDACDTDDDDDTVLDVNDNCPLIPNLDQINSDTDALGDECDDDDDDDGTKDVTDNCRTVPNPDQADSDNDGFGDACDKDTDQDGLPDPLEVANNLDPTKPDSDGDNISDGEEFGADFDNPIDTDGDDIIDAKDTDSDGDGIDDIDEAGDDDIDTPAVDSDEDGIPDFRDKDSDDDGIEDGLDNCPTKENPEQKDTDGDGLGDACTGDFDGDKILNDDDNCPFDANPLQGDVDMDGIGDICDPDADEDGVDEGDNCPNVANPNQEDLDGDGIGDACDTDIDDDTILNDVDNCPLAGNEDQSDFDGDGEGDVCDDDTDNDGISDAKDNCPFRSNPNQEDLDEDGKGDACDATDDSGCGCRSVEAPSNKSPIGLLLACIAMGAVFLRRRRITHT